ncbi:Anaphase-promoting complex subunit 1 [Taphrina deformans PYCC 5710]|uniref:Anaphase-promoting complex subunit 1 n=1 Tax=Taphrina deformans (strain PYCC 5710 / ATCC 11124 / CBS 356.35 / IMI 108563 / JCM 9778 / NBRC 8474) TaxID=1097556 RepID=R4X6L1_TAPDE|nr:Anaphase-promoting complex subunit 1 [Taphrina deformans PYCC 5710]|eukprot:CCG80780.1 Anaphase-promoting complex subunit 1 [Taphrina deformans PYCC 5710]
MSEYHARAQVAGKVEPHGLDYCRRNGLSSSFQHKDWICDFDTDDSEELLIVESTVIWTTGKKLKRAFNLAEEAQQVRQALFARFRRPESLFEQAEFIEQPTKNQRALLPNSRLFALNNAFKSTANVAHLHDLPQLIDTERALVILLEEILYVYHGDGRRDLVNLPFPVRKVFACKSGLMLERVLDVEDFPFSFQKSMDKIPKFFTLSDPLQHLGIASTTERTRRVLKAGDEICYVNGETLITHNVEEGSVSVWALKSFSATRSKQSIIPTSTSSMRRRSSMKVSTMGMPRMEGFSEEAHRSTTQLDLPAHFDRAPFNVLDPTTLFNDSSILHKDLLLEYIGSIPFENDSNSPKVYELEHASSNKFNFHLVSTSGQFLIELSVKHSKSGKLTMTHTRQNHVRNVAKIVLSTGLYSLVLDTEGFISLYSPGSPPILFQYAIQALDIREYHKKSFLYLDSNAEWQQVQLVTSDDAPFVTQALLNYKVILDGSQYHLFFATFLDTFCRFRNISTLDGFIISLFSCFLDPNKPRNVQVEHHFAKVDTTVIQKIIMADQLCQLHPTNELKQHLDKLVLALHFLMEENNLNVLDCNGVHILPALVQLSAWLSWEIYTNYYSALLPIGPELAIDDPIESLSTVLSPFREPPSLVRWITTMLLGQEEKLFSIEDLIPHSGSTNTAESRKAYKASSLCPVSKGIAQTYHSLVDNGSTLPDIVDVMMTAGLTKTVLNRLPQALAIPLKDAINSCALRPSSKWGPDALSYIGRDDLVHFLKQNEHREQHSNTTLESSTSKKTASVHNTSEIVSDEIFYSHKSGSEVVALIFEKDRRVQEVVKMLACHTPTSVQWSPSEQLGEAEQIRQQQKLSRLVANRTLAIPVGRAMFYFNSRFPVSTERFPIRKINFDVKIKPIKVTVSEDKSCQIPEIVSWPNFHNGVASGLSISRSAREISASWIAYNRPDELSDDHAGFLLGLGLNGHLKAMTTWHAFNYLTSKHSMTSIGLLLGLSASFLGTMDPMVAKLLTVHVLALLPSGSNELNLSGATQAAGVVGFGLLYFASTDRKLSSVLMGEIMDQDNSGDKFRDEGYRLAAGIALGMINIGRGTVKTGICDSTIAPRLLLAIHGLSREKHDLDVKMPGSIIALGLMYLRTNNKYIADRLVVPSTIHDQNYVRPDLYLLRVLATGLIMWNNISASTEYVESHLPVHLNKFSDLSRISGQTIDELVPLNIIVGACLAIGLKNAGSLAEGPRDFLLDHLDKMIKIFGTEDHGLVHKCLRLAIRTHLGVLSVAVAMIMAGSGDLLVLRRLRRLHYRLDQDAWYGNYMAIEMAVGLLFLNEGQSSLNTSDLAIASFVTAFYPILPSLPKDNQSHLQALRHLWALGAETRCLVPRDSTTKRACLFPIAIRFKDPARSLLRETAPCILPPIEIIDKVSATSDQYWPLELDLANSQSHRRAFSEDQTIYVTKRSEDRTNDSKSQAMFTNDLADVYENDSIEKDILAKFPGQSRDRLEFCRQILAKAQALSGSDAGGGRILLSLVQDNRDSRLQSQMQLLFAYWQAISTGLLSQKYQDISRSCLSEQFIQRLKLELWQKQHESSP